MFGNTAINGWNKSCILGVSLLELFDFSVDFSFDLLNTSILLSCVSFRFLMADWMKIEKSYMYF